MKKVPIIVFPFWCQEEVEQYCWLMERWHNTTKTDKEYQFLLLGRFDFRGDASKLFELCSKHAVTKYKTLTGSKVGHPLGCNEMWAKGMIELKRMGNVEFGFWMEYDVMPKDPEWFNHLHDKWDPELLVCGHLVTDEWLDANGFCPAKRKQNNWGEHVNGAAMYNPDIVKWIRNEYRYFTKAWDVKIYERIPKSFFKGFPMYDFRINPGRTKNSTDGLLIHGVKTLQEKREVYREL